MLQNILFVCSGNTCRSPMAEGLLRKELQLYGEKSANNLLEIRSAGIMAGSRLPASSEAVLVMAEQGVDLTRHQSQMLNQELLQWADLVLTMTANHRQHVISRYAIRPNQIYTLADFSGIEHMDVTDPFGLGIEAYRKSALQLQQLIKQLTPKILEMK